MDSPFPTLDIFPSRWPESDDIAFLTFVLLLGICYSLRGVTWDKPEPFHHLWFEKPQSDLAGSKIQGTRDIGIKLEKSVRIQ